MRYAAGAARDAWTQTRIRQLPVPWPSLARVIRPRGGQQIVLLAAPGVGKTTFALNWAAATNVPTLYLSADTDDQLMTTQLAALATGQRRDVVESRFAMYAEWRQLYAKAIRRKYPTLVLDFASSPYLPTVAAKCEALTEVWGTTPHLIVVDTASDVIRQGSDYSGWQQMWLQCRELARRFTSTVMICHHVTQGPAATGKVAPKLNDGQYKSEQFAEMVIGLHRTSDEVNVTVLKNRGGKSDVPVRLHAQYEYARLQEKDDKW